MPQRTIEDPWLAAAARILQPHPDDQADDDLDEWLHQLEGDYQRWLRALFPSYTLAPFATHHEVLWLWLWSIELGKKPRNPLVAVLPRGGAKSTSAELGCVALGCRTRRRYGLYICGTQDQADDHVSNVASLLESSEVERWYPDMAQRLVGKHGNSRGWRVNRLRTASGFTLDAVGLDTAARGVKLEDQRPDFMVVDDVDGEHDSLPVTRKKIKTLTRALFPAGSPDVAILCIQNLVHPRSVFARLAGVAPKEDRADFLANRHVIGPIPAVDGLVVEQQDDGTWKITAGTPTWEGQNLETCQAQVNEWGVSAFREEAQHEVEAPPGGMFDHLVYRQVAWGAFELARMVRVVCWVDPAVTDTDQSDSQAIQIDALGPDGIIYRLWSYEKRGSPLGTLCLALRKATELHAEKVGVETDQGGDTWDSVYREAVEHVRTGRDGGPALGLDWRPPRFDSDKAGAGHGPKAHRAGLMLSDYERGRMVHVLGTHEVLERALNRFPLTKPLDLTDAAYWSWQDLRKPGAVAVKSRDERMAGYRER